MHQWYYRDPQSRKIGPLSDHEFEERVHRGEIQPNTRVWRSGLADWTTYEALLAHATSCYEEASGPTASCAPQSSSQSTIVALGASATNHPPRGSCIATPSATPRGIMAPAFEKCRGCGEEVASHLFCEAGRRRICGFCVQKQEVKARRDKLRGARGVDANWIGKFLVRCALIAGVFVFGRVVLFELRHGGSTRPHLLPAIEAPSPNTPISSAPSIAPPSRERVAPAGNVELPPDIELVPPAPR